MPIVVDVDPRIDTEKLREQLRGVVRELVLEALWECGVLPAPTPEREYKPGDPAILTPVSEWAYPPGSVALEPLSDADGSDQ